MPDYRVVWEIDIFDVETPEDAAKQAQLRQRDPTSMATSFQVQQQTVDPTGLGIVLGEAVSIELPVTTLLYEEPTEDFCDTGMVTGKDNILYRISFAFEAVPLTLLEDLKPVLIEHALTQAEKSLQKSNLPGGTCRFIAVVPGRPEPLELPCVWYVVTPPTIPE